MEPQALTASPGVALEFCHARPSVSRNVGMDDLRWPGEKPRQHGDCRLEGSGGDVSLTGCGVPEDLDQEIHSRVVRALRPLETDISRLGPGGCGELLDYTWEVIGVLRAYQMPDHDEDHG